MYSKEQGESLAFWDCMASIHDEHQYSNNYKKLVRRVTDDVGAANRVLDVAAGTGIIALEIAKNVGVVEAIDNSPEMIATTQSKADKIGVKNVNLSIQNADKLDFPDHAFDVVVMCNSLHVMEKPDRALTEVMRVLEPDGLLAVPNACCGETREARIRVQQMMEERGFPIYHLFTAEGFYKLVQSCGFTVIERDRMPYRLPLEYLLARPTLQ